MPIHTVRRVAKEIQRLTPSDDDRNATIIFDRDQHIGAIPPNLRCAYNLDSDGREEVDAQ